jgi:hypothetical protein
MLAQDPGEGAESHATDASTNESTHSISNHIQRMRTVLFSSRKVFRDAMGQLDELLVVQR